MAEQADGRMEFSIERETSSRHGSALAERAEIGQRANLERSVSSPAVPDERDGFPDRIRRKYYVVADAARERGGDGTRSGSARVYADARGEYLAFKDTGARLTTRLDGADVARDMVAVAAHRGWDTIRVQGSADFRREAWLEASARGLEVRGHEPSDIDRAALAKREADGGAKAERDRRSSPGVVGRAEPAASEGPMRSSPLRNDRDDPASSGGTGASPSSEPPGRGSNREPGAGDLAARFRILDREAALRDPALAAAHSQLAVLDRSLREVFPTDARSRSVVLDAARERIAEHLERGGTFRRAELRVPDHERGSSRATGQALPEPSRPRERARMRERGRDR